VPVAFLVGVAGLVAFLLIGLIAATRLRRPDGDRVPASAPGR
jgi:hypothetical protein